MIINCKKSHCRCKIRIPIIEWESFVSQIQRENQLGTIDKTVTGARRRMQEKLERLNVEFLVSLGRGRGCTRNNSNIRTVEIFVSETNIRLNLDVMKEETLEFLKNENDEEFLSEFGLRENSQNIFVD